MAWCRSEEFERKNVTRFCLVKELCVQNTWLRRKENVAFRLGENETEIDCFDKKIKLMAFTKYGNPGGVSTCGSGSRYR